MKRLHGNSVSQRVYRRRRMAAGVALVAMSFVLYFSVGADADSPTEFYTVQPGDTLWDVASEGSSIADDPREEVEAVRQANDLSGYDVYPGQVLRIPG